MTEKRRGLGRGLGALIPTGLDGQRPTGAERPVDVFFPDPKREAAAAEAAAAEASAAVAVEADGETATAPATAEGPDGDASEAAGAVASASPMTDSGGGVATATLTEARPTTASPDADSAGTADVVGVDTRSAEAGGRAGLGPTHADAGSSADVAGSVDAIGEVTGAADMDGGSVLLPVPGARFAELPVLSIRPNPRQPRTVFDEDALEELVGSIKEIGVLQPIVVRDVGDGYELIMGERRWRATQLAGLTTVPAIIRDTDDADLLRDALLENLHRSNLNPLEEAAAYQQLLDDFGCTHEELAARISRSRPQISNTLRLLKLPPLVQRRLAAGVLSAGHARALLGLPDAAAQERLAQRIVAEGLSVRAVEEIVSLGGDPEPTARRTAPVAGQRNEALDHLAARLSDRFETRVKVSLGKSRGRLTVEFASVQDLNRILASLAPEDPGLLRG